jgi:hypothetical protein
MVGSSSRNLPAAQYFLECHFFKDNAGTYRRANRAEFPVQDPDDSVLGRVKHHIIQFVIPMHDPRAQLTLIRKMRAIPPHQLVKRWDISDGFVAIDVHSSGLGLGDGREGLELAREVRFLRAEGFEAELSGREGGEGC